MKRQRLLQLMQSVETEIDAMRARHEMELEPLEKEYEGLRKRIRRLDEAADRAKAYRIASKWDNKTPETPEEYREWLLVSKAAKKAFGNNPASAQPIHKVRKFGSGIRVFGAERFNEKYYTAFDAAGNIVGYLEVHPSQHPGDSTYVPTLVARGKKAKNIAQSGVPVAFNITKPLQTWIDAMEHGLAFVGMDAEN